MKEQIWLDSSVPKVVSLVFIVSTASNSAIEIAEFEEKNERIYTNIHMHKQSYTYYKYSLIDSWHEKQQRKLL